MQMRKSLKALFLPFIAVVLLAAGCSGKAGDSSSASEPLQVWEPDAKLLQKLGPMATVEEFQVRPPKGYSVSPPPPNAPAGMKGFAWAGALRDDKTAPQFMIVLQSPPPGEAKNMTLEQYLDKMLEGVKGRRTNWTQTPPERGQSNGLTFVRAYWTGTEPEKHWKMHGFMYVTKDASKFIHLTSQDVEPNHEQALKLAETAALTFKKR
jgi:hypothetical protein